MYHSFLDNFRTMMSIDYPGQSFGTNGTATLGQVHKDLRENWEKGT